MIEEGKLGVQEAVWLITIAIISKVFFSGPTTMVAIVGNADWYVTILSAAIAMIGFVFIYLLLKRFPEKDITEIFNLSLGRFFGFIFSGILALYMLFVSSTIFCSQYKSEGWYEQLGGNDGPLADAILDRIVHDAYKINIESIDPSKDISMREVYGLDKALSE